MEATQGEVSKLVDRQRAAFLEDTPVSLDTRLDRLDRGLAMIYENRERFVDAVAADWPGRSEQMNFLSEVMLPAQAFKSARKQLPQWIKPEKRKSIAPFNVLGAKAEIHYQPLGVIGVLAPWNAPINLLLVPLASIIAAGNRAILKPSEALPSVCQALKEACYDYFHEEELAVLIGDAQISAELCSAPLDHLMFTGGSTVAKKIMASAANNLTPLTLELGGKCPVIITADANIEDAAKRIAFGKLMNAGQACLSPDSVYIAKERREAFVTAFKQAAKEYFPNGFDDPAYGSIVHSQHYQHAQRILDDAKTKGATVTALDDKQLSPESLKLVPQLIINAPKDSLAMQKELFTPMLNIQEFTVLDQVLFELKTTEKPLGLYLFSGNSKQEKQIIENSFSGGVTVNDVIFHFFMPDLPFGGVGNSGMGAYSQGKHGFKQFSHARGVYKQAGPLALLRPNMPPYGKLYDTLIKAPLERDAKKWAKKSLKIQRQV